MGRIRIPESVKLFCGMLGSDVDLLRRAQQIMTRELGPVDLQSAPIAFTFTQFYEAEMGAGVQRLFVAFERRVRPDELADVKQFTNAIEMQLMEETLSESGRPVNLDPGYLDLGKIALATTKDRSHRLYLRNGIYAEVTLHYEYERWQPWPWTYPDYQSAAYHAFFDALRDRLREQRAQDAAGRGDGAL